MPGTDPTLPITAGRTLGGRYKLASMLARGGMAEVWEAHDEVLSRPVAVKTLQAHLSNDGVFLERFRREAVTAARLAHPCVVATYDTGIDSGTPYIVMELVRGETLRQMLSAQGALDPPTAFFVARQIADALSGAHGAGLVHRDIKPANILLVDDGWGGLRVKVTDFGIAKASEGLGADLTRTGTVLGTPKYLSPEQIRGLEPDARADLYSLGVVLFEMLTGDPPYSGNTDMATALAHLNDPIPRLPDHAPGLPREVDRLVTDLLAKDPAERVGSAQVLLERIDALPPLPSTPAVREKTSRSRDRVDAAVAGASTRAIGSAASLSAQRGAGNGTVAMDPGGPSTDPYGVARQPRERGPGGTVRRRVGIVVGVLLVVGAIIAAALLSASGSPSRRSGAPAPATRSQPGLTISSVDVYMANDRAPDNPSDLRYAFDGDPSTYWPTDQYGTPRFGNLYPGIGLAIHLSRPEQGRTLVVTSPNSGWAAETFVSAVSVATGQPVSAWGTPTDSKSDIPAGTITFKLGAHTGQWVLLWITNLGGRVSGFYEGRISELAFR